MSRVRVHCIVHGRVQGVYFRAATQAQARRLDLTGWVCNRYDGTVELVAEGPQTHVQLLVDWCHHGPSGAYVTHVDINWQDPAGDLAPFEIRYG